MHDPFCLQIGHPRARGADGRDVESLVPKAPELIQQEEPGGQVDRCDMSDPDWAGDGSSSFFLGGTQSRTRKSGVS